MTDCHVHIERGPYSISWLESFIKVALDKGIDDLYFLEHSHRFSEFEPTYESVRRFSNYQNDWYKRKAGLHLQSYVDFVNECRKIKFPIKVRFGLEICYFPEHEEVISEITRTHDWDFLTGSVHWIDGWGFDHKAEYWDISSIDRTYVRYYEIMIRLVKSQLFDILAHPDSIKCFNYNPSCDLSNLYRLLAELLEKNKMKTEFSAGLVNNYGHKELGMNLNLFRILQEKGVGLITASDAHSPEKVGMNIKNCLEKIEENRLTLVST